MRFSYLLIGAIFISACQDNSKPAKIKKADSPAVVAKAALTDPLQITCWGIGEIEFGDNLQTVTEKVGEANLSTDSLFLEGDFETLYLTAWKGTAKEIRIIWAEDKPPFKTISSLEISHPKSPYSFANGIKIGTTLKELEKFNGKPVKIYGFGWDYEGDFSNFTEGKLAKDMPCFDGVFSMDDSPIELLGDREFSSSHPAFKKHDAFLSEITIRNKK